MTEPVRLAKRLAELLPCSRRQAEQYIEGSWLRVDGKVVESPQFRVLDQMVELNPQARLDPVLPVTLLLHKPPGHDWSEGPRPALQLLTRATHWAADRWGQRMLERHLIARQCVTPLETGASGLMVFTQGTPVMRKQLQDAALVEHEVIVEVTGEVTTGMVQCMNRSPVIDGRAMLPAKVSLTHHVGALTGLRFAVKGKQPGQIAQMCEQVGRAVTAMKRIRVGCVPLSALSSGQWRYLSPGEKF